jgi:predicted HD superfamily hydrolase involved in NAD metabolism
MHLSEIKQQLKQNLKPERYEHTLGVMYTAAALAMRYDEKIEDALLGGLLHDCAKYGSIAEQIARCEQYGLQLEPSDLEIPALIHAKLGAKVAERDYEITSTKILNAILYHTTGRPKMTKLEQIVYLADYIEPGRSMISGLEQIRKAAFVDMDEAVALSAKNTLSFLERKGRSIDPLTVQTYEYYYKNKKHKKHSKEKR